MAKFLSKHFFSFWRQINSPTSAKETQNRKYNISNNNNNHSNHHKQPSRATKRPTSTSNKNNYYNKMHLFCLRHIAYSYINILYLCWLIRANSRSTGTCCIIVKDPTTINFFFALIEGDGELKQQTKNDNNTKILDKMYLCYSTIVQLICKNKL